MLLDDCQLKLLELISVALCDKTHDDVSSLSCYFSQQKWSALLNVAFRQGVSAIVSDALTVVPNNLKQYKSLYYKLLLSTLQVEKNYIDRLNTAEWLSNIWKENGIQTICLKGVVFSLYYPIPRHRECGDFDCYLLGDYEKGNRVAEDAGAALNTKWYKHSQIFINNLLAENHRMLVTTREGKKNKTLNKHLLNVLESEGFFPIHDGSAIYSPNHLFNAEFQTFHSFCHFLEEGISLRHICDWYSFLRCHQHDINWVDFYSFCQEYKYDRFIYSLTDICVNILGLKIDEKSIRYTNEYSHRVLYSVFNDNSRIFSNGKSRWHNRFLLISNTLKFSWKYHKIAKQSCLSYILRMIFGFIFKLE